jgi:hypothetical protein
LNKTDCRDALQIAAILEPKAKIRLDRNQASTFLRQHRLTILMLRAAPTPGIKVCQNVVSLGRQRRVAVIAEGQSHERSD